MLCGVSLQNLGGGSRFKAPHTEDYLSPQPDGFLVSQVAVHNFAIFCHIFWTLPPTPVGQMRFRVIVPLSS